MSVCVYVKGKSKIKGMKALRCYSKKKHQLRK